MQRFGEYARQGMERKKAARFIFERAFGNCRLWNELEVTISEVNIFENCRTSDDFA